MAKRDVAKLAGVAILGAVALYWVNRQFRRGTQLELELVDWERLAEGDPSYLLFQIGSMGKISPDRQEMVLDWSSTLLPLIHAGDLQGCERQLEVFFDRCMPERSHRDDDISLARFRRTLKKAASCLVTEPHEARKILSIWQYRWVHGSEILPHTEMMLAVLALSAGMKYLGGKRQLRRNYDQQSRDQVLSLLRRTQDLLGSTEAEARRELFNDLSLAVFTVEQAA